MVDQLLENYGNSKNNGSLHRFSSKKNMTLIGGKESGLTKAVETAIL